MTTATYSNPLYQPAVVRLRTRRLAVLLFLLLAVLVGGGLWVLSTFGKKVVSVPVESLTQPSWIKEAVAYAPEATATTKAVASPDRSADIMRQLATMQQEMQAQREALEALKKRPAVAPAPATKATAPAPAPKAPGSMLFVSHELKEAKDGPKASEYTLAPGATKLPCILETKIISDVEGHFTCRVTTNVYDTATGQHLLVPQGSTVLGNDQANTLVYGSNRMDTVSLTLALPDGRTVDLGKAPVTDQQGVAGLDRGREQSLRQALWCRVHWRGAEGRHQCDADCRHRSRRGGAGHVRTLNPGQPGDDESRAAVHQHSPDHHHRGRPTLHGPVDQTPAPAGDVAGHDTHRNTEVGMTKAERLAAKIQRDRETLERQRQVLADSEATLRAEIRHSEAALREEERKATDKRRYQVGALAEEAGLFAMSNTELAEVFAALGALRAGERPGAVLEALVGYPERFSGEGTGRHPGWRQGEKKTRKKSGAIGFLCEKPNPWGRTRARP